jgi:uroporphyrinogen decarboxylase
MNGLERVTAVLEGKPVDRPPVLPIVHSGLAGLCGARLGEYFADAEVMARVMVEGARRFGLDGVQLTLGVVAEPEALGAATTSSPDGGPVLRQHLLSDLSNLDSLRRRDPGAGGRMPMFARAVEQVSRELDGQAFVLATLRGPMNITSQLRGVEDALVDMLERPEAIGEVLSFATDVAVQVSRSLVGCGAHGLMFGEATCSPNFISPDLYRQLVWPLHVKMVGELRRMGWHCVGLHVCGNILPILPDLIATGANLLDVDYQVPAARAIESAGGRVTLRGNLDPSSVFRFGTADKVRCETRELCRAVAGAGWIVGSGCDIPPGTPAENLQAFVEAAR